MVDSTFNMPQTPEEQSKFYMVPYASLNDYSVNGKDAQRWGQYVLQAKGFPKSDFKVVQSHSFHQKFPAG